MERFHHLRQNIGVKEVFLHVDSTSRPRESSRRSSKSLSEISIPSIFIRSRKDSKAFQYPSRSTAWFFKLVDEQQSGNSPTMPGQHYRPGVVLPAVVSAKVLLWNAMFDAGMRKADLAPRLNLSPTVIDRLFSLAQASLIGQIETALAVLGKKLVVGVREAAWQTGSILIFFVRYSPIFLMQHTLCPLPDD